MKKIFVIALATLLVGATIIGMTSCMSQADVVNYNLSKDADYFRCERKITVYNARTDTIIFEAEGYMSLSNNSTSELVVTFMVGPNEYRKNYVYLNDYTLYVVEDITGTHTDPYHYVWHFNPRAAIPTIEVE